MQRVCSLKESYQREEWIHKKEDQYKLALEGLIDSCFNDIHFTYLSL